MEARQKIKMNMLSIFLSVLFFNSAGGIKVQWGTNDGPIVPPTPAPPTPPPQKPYKIPAAAWEELSDDIPNPNPYRPTYIHIPEHYGYSKPSPTDVGSTVQTAVVQPSIEPQVRQPYHTRYTSIRYKLKSTEQPPTTTLAPAKAFVNAYAKPTSSTSSPLSTQRTIEITPRPESYYNNNNNNDNNYINNNNRQENRYQTIEDNINKGFSHHNYNSVPQLTLNYNPGFGFKYASQVDEKDPRRYYKAYKDYERNDDKYNALETNDIYGDRLHQNDLDLTYEKHMAQRFKKSPNQYYVPHQPITYYNSQPQLFFPAGFIRHQ